MCQINYENNWNEFIAEKMYNYRKNALRKLSTVVQNEYVEDFAKILIYGWSEEDPTSRKLTNILDFYPIDFIAIQEDLKEFENLYVKEKYDEIGENLYYE